MSICPSCGTDVYRLHDITGFCAACSGCLICSSCGVFFKEPGQFRHHCPTCRVTDWEARNADRIERWMGTGLTYKQAVQLVKNENRPYCLGCGEQIRNGTKGRHFFCRANSECRRLARRYRWLRERYGLPKEEAIDKTLTSNNKQQAA